MVKTDQVANRLMGMNSNWEILVKLVPIKDSLRKVTQEVSAIIKWAGIQDKNYQKLVSIAV